MKLPETKWENQTEPKSGMRCSVRARPLRGLAGRLSRPTSATQNKQSDCPQNPAHLLSRIRDDASHSDQYVALIITVHNVFDI